MIADSIFPIYIYIDIFLLVNCEVSVLNDENLVTKQVLIHRWPIMEPHHRLMDLTEECGLYNFQRFLFPISSIYHEHYMYVVKCLGHLFLIPYSHN